MGCKRDFQIGMDNQVISQMLYDYTSGYPFLVSRICKIMDEILPGHGEFCSRASIWTKSGMAEAVKELLAESNSLFDDMVKKMNDFPKLRKILYVILFNGERISYSASSHIISLGIMFGFLKEHQESTKNSD